MINLFFVATGGALGAALRYLTSISFNYFFYYSFIGTLCINVLGSFLIGLLVYFIKNKELSEEVIKYFFIIGLLGSYTTFSAFSLETIELFMNNKLLLSFAYIILSLVLCILATYIGFNIEKIIHWKK